ncbi:Imm32 family immunity protein [Streptomyces collinus]|uniref:Imm32 family immunity protein n=1 Tax=Streptomyces collinus TaxID=42684 RepID=UPI00382F1C69
MASEPGRAPSATTHVRTAADGVTRVFAWEEGARIEVRNLGGEIVVEANAAGLKTLAGHLLTLAQDGTPDGTHLHLEEGNGLEAGSVGLVLERCDDA